MKFLFLFLLSFNLYASENVSSDFSAALESISQGPSAFSCMSFDFFGNGLSSAYRENKADCSKFINNAGELGPHGKIIYTHIGKVTKSKYLSPIIPGMDSICPKWGWLTEREKKMFWVWFFAAIAWKESTCNEKAINKAATDGSAMGYLQLNEKLSARKWRGGSSGKSCATANIHPAEHNLKCGVEILNEQLRGHEGLYESNGQLSGKGSNSYWQDLRGNGKEKIKSMVKSFPGCT